MIMGFIRIQDRVDGLGDGGGGIGYVGEGWKGLGGCVHGGSLGLRGGVGDALEMKWFEHPRGYVGGRRRRDGISERQSCACGLKTPYEFDPQVANVRHVDCNLTTHSQERCQITRKKPESHSPSFLFTQTSFLVKRTPRPVAVSF